MRSRVLLLSAASVALPAVTAQEPSLAAWEAELPRCATLCLADEVDRTACSSLNETCVCSDQPLQQLFAGCVTANCTIREALLTKNLTATFCERPVRDKSREYVAISDAFGILSALFVIQRLGFKLWAKLEFGLDDLFILLAVFSGIPISVINAHGVVDNGMGRDAWTVTPEELSAFGRYFYIMQLTYFVEVALLKLALLFFFIRIFPSATVRRLLWGTVVFVSLFGVAFVLATTFQCTPIEHYWLKWDGEHKGTCLDLNAMSWANAAISIAVDVWMLAIPLWQLKRLTLDWRKKVAVATMFCVGTFVTVVSILRLQSLAKLGSFSTNPTWDYFDVGVWSTVEINVGIICACLPSFRLLLVRLFPRLLGTTQRRNARYPSTGPAYPAGTGAQGRASRGTGNMSRVERSQHRPEPPPNQISYQKTYAVEYGERESDSDEVQLVHMQDVEGGSASSGRP